MCLLAVSDPQVRQPFAAESLVSAGGGPGNEPVAWLGWLGGSFLGVQPTAREWSLVWYEARMVPRNLYDLLIGRGVPLWLVNGIPITDHPTIRHLAGKLVGYPGDLNTTFDRIAGVETVTGCVVSVGKLARREHGSIAVLAHEVWHAVCRHLKPFPYEPAFQAIWRSQSWGNPALDASSWELWAETAAWFGALRSLGLGYDGNYTPGLYHYHAGLWYEHGWLDWPAGV